MSIWGQVPKGQKCPFEKRPQKDKRKEENYGLYKYKRKDG